MGLFSALSVSATGLAAQRTRAEVITENLANAETTRTPEGGPYRRKDVVFESAGSTNDFRSALGEAIAGQAAGVQVSEIVTDMRDPERRYIPGHPDADKDGYVLSLASIPLRTWWI